MASNEPTGARADKTPKRSTRSTRPSLVAGLPDLTRRRQTVSRKRVNKEAKQASTLPARDTPAGAGGTKLPPSPRGPARPGVHD